MVPTLSTVDLEPYTLNRKRTATAIDLMIPVTMMAWPVEEWSLVGSLHSSLQ